MFYVETRCPGFKKNTPVALNHYIPPVVWSFILAENRIELCRMRKSKRKAAILLGKWKSLDSKQLNPRYANSLRDYTFISSIRRRTTWQSTSWNERLKLRATRSFSKNWVWLNQSSRWSRFVFSLRISCVFTIRVLMRQKARSWSERGSPLLWRLFTLVLVPRRALFRAAVQASGSKRQIKPVVCDCFYCYCGFDFDSHF